MGNAQLQDASTGQDLRNIECLIRPRSIGVVGVSPTPGAAGTAVVVNLENFAYQGEVHLVSRGRTEVGGRKCVPTIDELPPGLDTIVLAVPVDVVVDSVRACAARRARSVVVFAAGFAEAGEEGIEAQREIAQISEEAGMPVLGPNCLGLTNFVDGIPVTFGPANRRSLAGKQALAVLSQSGGMMGNIRLASFARGVDLSYAISTGNEAAVGVEDFLAFLVEDDAVPAIAMFVEHVRKPQVFLDLLRRAKQKRKPVVLLHPGRSARAKESAESHTGALAGDHEVMSAMVRATGAVLVDSIEELTDAAWLLSKWPAVTMEGVGLVTDSGAVKGFSLDFAESVGLPLPKLADATCEALRAVLPEFSTASNPLDVTAQGLRDMELYGNAAQALLKDPDIGGLAVVLMPGSPATGLAKFRSLQPVIASATVPLTYTMLGGDSPLAPELVEEIQSSGVPFFRSPERALRAMRHLVDYGRTRAEAQHDSVRSGALPSIEGHGTLVEYRGKEWLRELGVRIPAGRLACTVEDAVEIARDIDYPIVLKAQAAELPHKSDVGGVAVGIRDDDALRRAWTRMYDDVAHARPDLKLDGLLVEGFAPAGGIEMIVGARRDPEWGPVLMVGLGGIWTELLNDIRLMPADASHAQIAGQIAQLRGAEVLNGARGRKPADIEALVNVVARIGTAFAAEPRLQELDINPLAVYPRGEGVLALDAVLVLS